MKKTQMSREKIRFSKSCPLVVDFLRASGGIISKKTLVESEETYSDLRATGNRATWNRVMRGLGVYTLAQLKKFSLTPQKLKSIMEIWLLGRSLLYLLCGPFAAYEDA